MGVFLAIVMMMTTGSVAVFAIVRAFRNRTAVNEKNRFIMVLMPAVTLLILCDFLFGGDSLELRLPFDMTISLLPLLALTCSMNESHRTSSAGKILLLPPLLALIFYILQGIGIIPAVRACSFIPLAAFVSMLAGVFYIIAIAMRLRSVNLVMNCGNAWSYASITMDSVYLLFMMLDVLLLTTTLCVSVLYARIVSAIVSLLLVLQLAALGLRVIMDSLFVIWQRQERRIVESMKMSQNDIAKTSQKTNELYSDIYARIVALFETEKPYLNSELTINDVVKMIFTNKLYISRAISRFTGRNFCQFVNYYRVTHSIKIFRDNPDLKVVELASQSGFNSSVSFSMAFRLYMSECPSDWCRKERNKIARGIK